MISVFEIFKIGIGPSSSHTVGPMKAAATFAQDVARQGLLGVVDRVEVRLLGSLAWTGKVHATDKAVMLGLAGQWPNSVDPAKGERTIAQIRERKRLSFDRSHAITFDPGADIVFDNTSEAKRHPNTMVLRAFDAHGIPLLEQTWCSVGGGFVCREEEVGKESATNLKTPAPFDFRSGEDPLTLGQESRLSIAEMVMANECAYPAAKTWKPTWTRSSQR